MTDKQFELIIVWLGIIAKGIGIIIADTCSEGSHKTYMKIVNGQKND